VAKQNPNVMSGGDDDAPLEEGEASISPLQLLAELAHPSDYSTHIKQVILGKELRNTEPTLRL
jgi:hypothetical protein